jgi:hypothetical protein
MQSSLSWYRTAPSGCADGSTIHVAAVTETDYDDAYLPVVDLPDDPVIANPVLPELTEFVTFQGGAE